MMSLPAWLRWPSSQVKQARSPNRDYIDFMAADCTFHEGPVRIYQFKPNQTAGLEFREFTKVYRIVNSDYQPVDVRELYLVGENTIMVRYGNGVSPSPYWKLECEFLTTPLVAKPLPNGKKTNISVPSPKSVKELTKDYDPVAIAFLKDVTSKLRDESWLRENLTDYGSIIFDQRGYMPPETVKLIRNELEVAGWKVHHSEDDDDHMGSFSKFTLRQPNG